MATYTESAALARDYQFRDRVQVAMLKCAVNIAAESASGDENRDVRRASLATECLRNPSTMVEPFAWAMITNAVITGEASDSDLEYTVTTIWDAIAGV